MQVLGLLSHLGKSPVRICHKWAVRFDRVSGLVHMMLISGVNLTGSWGAQTFGSTFFWVCLWGCFWVRVTFELVGWVKPTGVSRVGAGRSPRGRHGNPLQNSCLKNSMDRGAWRVKVHGITKNWTWPSIQHIHTHTVWVTSFNQLKIWTERKGWVRGDSFCFTVWAGCGSFPTFGLNWKVNFSWVLNLLAFRLELLPPAFLGL